MLRLTNIGNLSTYNSVTGLFENITNCNVDIENDLIINIDCEITRSHDSIKSIDCQKVINVFNKYEN